MTARSVECLVQNTITLFIVLPRSRDLARKATQKKAAQESVNTILRIVGLLATNPATYVPVCHHVTNHYQLFPG
jgi:hypothetical protein